MKAKIPIVPNEIKMYIEDLYGEKIAKGYFEKIATPMEEYTLHVYKNESVIDGILQTLQENGFQPSVHKDYSNLIICSPKGPFKLDKQSDLKKIVVDLIASEMIFQGADIYVPGVKRANKVKKSDKVNVVNQQDIHVANARSLMSHNEMLETKKGLAAKNLQSPYIVPSLEQQELTDLPVYFQSIPAYLASLNLEPKRNERILDCCAAPGNKTIHLSEIAGEEAKIVAVDRSKNRLKKLKERANKFGIKNIEIKNADIIELSKNWNLTFDKIMIDPPCSALGLRPRLTIDTSKDKINAMSRYQKAILYACDKLIKKGGEIVYSTCTITEEENEDIIDYAIKKLDFEVLEQNYRYSDYKAISKDSKYPVQRFIPGIHKTLGYFIVKIRKI
jgi:predicted RNA-binding protein (TIGR00451 family)